MKQHYFASPSTDKFFLHPSQQDPFLIREPSPSAFPNTLVQKVKSSPPPPAAFVSRFKDPFVSVTYTNDNTMHRFRLLPPSARNDRVSCDISELIIFLCNPPDSHCISTQLLVFITHVFKARPAYTNSDFLNLFTHHIGAGNYYSEEDPSVPCMTFDLVLR